MLRTCPRCATQTDKDICPICFTRIVPVQNQNPAPYGAPQNTWQPLTQAETAVLPPFICPRCGGRTLLKNGARYCCAGCGAGFSLTMPQAPQNPQNETNAQDLNSSANAQNPAEPQGAQNTPPVPNPAPAQPEKKTKKGFTRGKLAVILCGAALIFCIGTGVALGVSGGMEHTSSGLSWNDFLDDSPFNSDPFSSNPFGDDFNPFGNNDPFNGDSSGNDSAALPKQQSDEYPNGCSDAEYARLEQGMSYAQISAIIGGDASNYYNDTYNGQKCTVFQWYSEDMLTYVNAVMVDGKAAEYFWGYLSE